MPQVGKALNLTLTAERVKQAETDAYIVDRLADALDVHEVCGSEAQRIDYHVLLGGAAPEKKPARDPKGMARRVAERLRRNRYNRYTAAGEQRPRAFQQAIDRRAAFDSAVDVGKGPLKPGDAATSFGRVCTVIERSITKPTHASWAARFAWICPKMDSLDYLGRF